MVYQNVDLIMMDYGIKYFTIVLLRFPFMATILISNGGGEEEQEILKRMQLVMSLETYLILFCLIYFYMSLIGELSGRIRNWFSANDWSSVCHLDFNTIEGSPTPYTTASIQT